MGDTTKQAVTTAAVEQAQEAAAEAQRIVDNNEQDCVTDLCLAQAALAQLIADMRVGNPGRTRDRANKTLDRVVADLDAFRERLAKHDDLVTYAQEEKIRARGLATVRKYQQREGK